MLLACTEQLGVEDDVAQRGVLEHHHALADDRRQHEPHRLGRQHHRHHLGLAHADGVRRLRLAAGHGVDAGAEHLGEHATVVEREAADHGEQAAGLGGGVGACSGDHPTGRSSAGRSGTARKNSTTTVAGQRTQACSDSRAVASRNPKIIEVTMAMPAACRVATSPSPMAFQTLGAVRRSQISGSNWPASSNLPEHPVHAPPRARRRRPRWQIRWRARPFGPGASNSTVARITTPAAFRSSSEAVRRRSMRPAPCRPGRTR